MSDALTPEEAAYSWIEDWEGIGCCVALVRDVAAEEALVRLVTKPKTTVGRVEQIRTWAEGHQYPAYGNSVEATTVGDWTVIVEINGYQATLDEPLARLSRGTKAAVVYWNVNALMGFYWSVDGTQVRYFDPLLYDNPGWLGNPLPQEEGLTFGLGHPRAAAMACAERLTGVRLTRAFLDDRADWIAVGHNPGD